jgi:hypothetical protein
MTESFAMSQCFAGVSGPPFSCLHVNTLRAPCAAPADAGAGLPRPC